MATVETARGPVEAAALGTTLMHEHVFVLTADVEQNFGHLWWDEEERVADAVARLTELRRRGVDTIADPTVVGLGRYIPRIQRVAAEVDINIVVATGVYTYGDLPFAFRFREPGAPVDSPEHMAALFVDDLRTGIAGTGVRAGFLKCCVERELTPGVELVLRAVARAHLETGAGITVHTNARRRTGLLALRVLREEGADLTRVVLGHSGDSNDIPHLRELLDSGAVLGMDRFGLDLYNTTADRVATVAELCRLGYADQMVLSQDASCFIDWFPMPDQRQAVAALLPNWRYTHIHDDVLPALRARGVDESHLRRMLVETPRRLLSPPD